MTNTIEIKWSTEDVRSVRSDLTEAQCRKVLAKVRAQHDASIGVNWEVLEIVAGTLYPER